MRGKKKDKNLLNGQKKHSGRKPYMPIFAILPLIELSRGKKSQKQYSYNVRN
jgi:hypothetical protein